MSNLFNVHFNIQQASVFHDTTGHRPVQLEAVLLQHAGRCHVLREDIPDNLLQFQLPKSNFANLPNRLRADTLGPEWRENHIANLADGLATKEQKTKFITTGVSWFAEENKLTFAKAYQFLLLYKGIDFLESSFRYEQTLPRAIVLQDLSRICANNGGRL